MGSMIDALEDAVTTKPKVSGGGSMARMLEAGGAAAARAAPTAGPDEFDKSLAPEGALEGWVKPAAKKLVGAGADLVDLVFTGLLAPPVAAAGQMTTMIQGELNDGLGIKKSTRRERAQAGLETAGRINKALGTPVRSLLTSLGYLSADDAPVEEAMGKVMSLVERDAAAVEERTGGKVLKEDVLGAVNVLFGGLGAKGTQIAGKQVVSAKAAKAATKALEDLKAERAGENLRADEAAAATQQAADEAAATAAAQDAGLKSANLKPDYPARKGTQQRYADPNQLRLPADDALGGVDPTLALSAAKARKARRSEVRAAFTEDPNYADFSEGQAALADRARDGTQTPPVPGGPTRLDGPDYSVGMAPRRSTDAVRLEADPVRGVAEVQDLSSALTKVGSGRAFDLTAVERLALRASKSVTDPKVITAAAVGATGLGLAMAMGPDADEAALAVGAGALMLGRGKGLTLDAMTKMGEATPLGAILDQSATTLSTLEKLPRNRFEFSVQSIQELLKRQEVTKAERDVFAKALEGKPADGTVTAKNLMVGVKKATGDFELTKQASDEFADYGLDRIERSVPDENGYSEYSPEDVRGATIEFNPHSNRYDILSPAGELLDTAPTVGGRTPREQVLADWRERALKALEGGPNGVATHIYRVPDSITLGTNNHFGDPQYFGHTRVFEEGGIRHVVELQSDLAQKAGKVLGAEERAGLTTELATHDRLALVSEEVHGVINDVRSTVNDYVTALNKLEAAYPPDILEDVKLRLGKRINDRYGGHNLAPIAVRKFDDFDAAGEFDKIYDYVKAAYVEAAQSRRIDRSDISALSSALENALYNEYRGLDARRAELKAKLAESGTLESVEPMLKNWHKRLIREELADGARAGEVQVRFADADTVAKVEGWPRSMTYREGTTTFDEAYTKFRRVGNITLSSGEKVFGDYKATGNLRVKNGHVEAELEGPQGGLRGPVSTVWAPEGTVRFAPKSEAAKALGQVEALSPEHQGIYDRYAGDVTKFLKQLGGKHVVDSAGHGWWEVPVEGSKAVPAGKRVQQFGGASQELLEKVAVIGGAGALAAYLSSDESRVRNAGMAAVVAGLAIFARSRSPQVAEWAGQAGRGAEYTLGLVSTRVKDLSPALLRRMRDHEMGVLKSTHENLVKVAPFIESLRKVPAELRDKLNRAILSGELGEVISLLGRSGNPELVKQWRDARGLLDTLGKDLVATGRLKGLLPDYYPRVVIDAPGLLKALGKEDRSFLQKKIDEATRNAARKDGRDLSPLETSQIINAYLKGRGPTAGRPGHLKQRSVAEVTEDLAPFYAPASESLPLYVRAVTNEIQRAKFFGDDLVRDPQAGLTNLDLSIGGLVERERALRKLDDMQVEELRSMLTSRFGPGEKGSAGIIQTAKNLTNAGLLGHATSAFVQLGDILVSTYAHGILPTIKGLQQVTTRDPARISVRDLGFVNHISEEIVTANRKPVVVAGMTLSSAKFLDSVFKYSGFSLVDQLGKNVSIAAAADKLARATRTPAGTAKLREKYKDAYSSAELDQLVSDFRASENTDLTRSVLFSELSDIQPISKLEVPQAYLDMPNGRIVYMLKTFMLKQADIVRRDAIREFSRGNYGKATNNLLRYSIALGIGGATTGFIRDWLLGKETQADWGTLPDNVLKTFGMSQYVIEKARKGEPIAAIGQTALPPYKMWEHILTTEPEAIQYLPIAGKFLYMHAAGGKEKANAAAEKRAAAAERKAEGFGKEKEE